MNTKRKNMPKLPESLFGLRFPGWKVLESYSVSLVNIWFFLPWTETMIGYITAGPENDHLNILTGRHKASRGCSCSTESKAAIWNPGILYFGTSIEFLFNTCTEQNFCLFYFWTSSLLLVPERARDDHACHPCGRPAGASGSCFQPGPVLAFEAICEVNQ